MDSGRIDLSAELVGLFEDEALIAFCEFSAVVPDRDNLTGLCKIARPKECPDSAGSGRAEARFATRLNAALT